MRYNPGIIKHRYARPVIYSVLLAGIALFFIRQYSLASPTNGFDLDHALVPADQIHHGGPPRDGIPAIDTPDFVTVSQAGFLKASDRILGIYRNGIAKAYAVRILTYHEIVNDTFSGEAIVVTFCPLCGTGMAFKAGTRQHPRKFGVSGLLYNSDVLLYDRQTESLWSQLMKRAISGPLKGQRLEAIPLSHTTWQDWRSEHPDTRVLSLNTGYTRDYESSPYGDYNQSRSIFFPVQFLAKGYHPKEQVIGLELDNTFKAYPFVELAKTNRTRIRDTVARQPIDILFDPVNRTGKVMDTSGKEIPTVISFWFAWMTFHPESEVFKTK